jgi:hypothetical protein
MVYASRLSNIVEQNYSTTKREALTMVFSLHKFRHYLLGNKLLFYVNHMAPVNLVNKPHVSRKITKWLLIFFKYDFTIMYKPCRTRVVIDALLTLPDIIEPTSVFDQTTYASLFYTGPEWFNDVKDFLKTGQIEGMLSM